MQMQGNMKVNKVRGKNDSHQFNQNDNMGPSALHFSGDFHQSQSQFSEFDDNMSQVIMNYENLTGLIQNNMGGPGGSNAQTNRMRGRGNVPNIMANQSGAMGPGGRHAGQVPGQGGRAGNRLNMSSNLYDFIRDTTDSEAII